MVFVLNVKKNNMTQRKKYYEILKIKIPRNLITFLIFVFITLILWFLNSLNSEYSTNIDVPVQYTMPNKNVNATDLPQTFNVSVRGFGYNILKFELKNTFSTFQIDLGKVTYKIKRNQDTNTFFIETSQLKRAIQNYFFNDLLAVENIKPDTIYFKLSALTKKLVTVKLDAQITTQNQFIVIGENIISPSNINVSGPKHILDTLKYIYTKPVVLKDLNESVTTDVELKQVEGLFYSKNKVKLTVNVKEYTELRYSSAIDMLNVPDTVNLVLIPNKVTVICKVPIDKVDSINDNSFKAFVDYTKIESMGSKVRVEMSSSSPFVIELAASPEFVDYLIEKK